MAWTWSFERPVYANMPIWSVMCVQSLVEPWSASADFRDARMAWIRSAMALHSPVQRSRRAGSPSTAATIRAPWIGGLEYMGRMTAFSCDSRRLASSGDAQTAESAPMRSPYRPKFFAYDWQSRISWPSATNFRIAYASRSASPDAKPWYAQSKKTWRSWSLSAPDRSAHCSGDGSTPVGLCAHAWRSTEEPGSAASKSAFMPS
mmetsp:Transcript_1112/g.3308  ORF Transcript_1112/g.3308 Transcript_1112/m.3308 type:complete len:204 (+) Transcript_1112:163-774(+)